MNSNRVLVIEDDKNISAFIKEHLSSLGYHVETALDGEKGLEALRSEPNLVLLDIMLPNISGLELMKAIREQGTWGKKVPIIIISNLNPESDEILKASAAYEPMYYLVKADFSLEEIASKVKEALPLT